MLEDWFPLLQCWQLFKQTPHAKQVDGTSDTLKALFQMSLVSPSVCILLLWEGTRVRGFAILTENQATQVNPSTGAVEIVTHGFVRGVHIQPGTPLRHSLAMETHICEWGRSRRHPFLTGWCSEEYFERAQNPYRRLGWEKSNIVVAKKL